MPPKTRGAVRKPRKKDKKNIALGQAHIKSTFNNTIVSITDPNGAVISWASSGEVGFKGSRKSTPFAAQMAAEAAAKRAQEHGMRKVDVFVKGPGSGRETPSVRCRPLASRLAPSRTSPPQPTTAAARRSAAASKSSCRRACPDQQWAGQAQRVKSQTEFPPPVLRHIADARRKET